MRGQVLYALIMFTVSLWVLGLLWPIFHDIVINTFVPAMASAGVDTAFITNYQAVFKALPFVYFVLLMVWVYVYVHRKDAEQGGGF